MGNCMKSFVVAAALTLALASPAYALTYSKTIPAMGPGLMGGPAVDGGNCTLPASTLPPCTKPVAVVAMQVVEQAGYVDWVEKGWDQNWLCLGYSSGSFPSGTPNTYSGITAAGSNISDNYPVMSIFAVHFTTTRGIQDDWDAGTAFGGSTNAAQLSDLTNGSTAWPNATITTVATVTVSSPEDYNSSTHTCSAEGNDCHGFYHIFKPLGSGSTPYSWPPPTYIYAGDLLVWAITRGGSYCPGQYYLEQQLGHTYPTAVSGYQYPSTAAGEITLGFHVYEDNTAGTAGNVPFYQYSGPANY